MRDTTTTIDEILGQLLGRASVEFMSHPDGKRIVMPAKELYNFQQEAKQAILQWHKDKARSYVLEVIGEDEVQEWDSDYTMCKHCEFQLMDDTQDCICIQRNKLRAEQRAKLDQSLKAIGGEE